jgi:hypothetical protein
MFVEMGRTIRFREQRDGRPGFEDGYRAYVHCRRLIEADEPGCAARLGGSIYAKSPLLKTESEAAVWKTRIED